MKVAWEYDPQATFAGLRTYAWIPGQQPRSGDPRVDDRGADRRVRQAIDTQLATQGFVAAAPETADFWIGYHVRLVDRTDASTTHSYYGYNRAWGGDAGLDRGWFLAGAPATYTRRYDVGTLAVFVERPNTEQPIWQGFAQAVVEPSDDLDTRRERLAKAASLILEHFPPGAAQPAPHRAGEPTPQR